MVGHDELVRGLAWSPDGSRIASCDSQGVVIVWSPIAGEVVREWQMPGDTLSTAGRPLAWSIDGKILAGGTPDSTITLWESDTGRALGVLSGHEDTVAGLVWSTDGLVLVSSSHDGTVRLWGIPREGAVDR